MRVRTGERGPTRSDVHAGRLSRPHRVSVGQQGTAAGGLKDKTESAAGDPGWEAPAAGSSRGRSRQGIGATARRRSAPVGRGRPARCAARSARVLADHQGHRHRYHGDQWFRHRRHRWAGAPGTRPVFGPRPDAAARQHARRGRDPGRGVAVVSVVGRQHPASTTACGRCPEALQVAGRDIAAGMAMLEARHIADDRARPGCWSAAPPAVAGRDRLPVRRTGRHAQARWQRQIAHRAEPDLKAWPWWPARRSAAQRAGHRATADVYPSHSLVSPTGSLGGAHLALLNVRTELHRSPAWPRPLLAQFADEIGPPCGSGPVRPGPDALRRRPHRSATTSTPDCALPETPRAAGFRPASPGAPATGRGCDRVRWRGDAGPRRAARAGPA